VGGIAPEGGPSVKLLDYPADRTAVVPAGAAAPALAMAGESGGMALGTPGFIMNDADDLLPRSH